MGRRSVWLCFLICSRFAVRSVTQALNTHACRCCLQGAYRTLIKPAFCQRAKLVRHSEGRESAFRRGACPRCDLTPAGDLRARFASAARASLKTGDQSLIKDSLGSAFRLVCSCGKDQASPDALCRRGVL